MKSVSKLFSSVLRTGALALTLLGLLTVMLSNFVPATAFAASHRASDELPPTNPQTVYVTAARSGIFALNTSNGTVRWKFPDATPLSGLSEVVNGLIYFGEWQSSDALFYALNADTGAVVWKYSLGNVSRITHPVVAANGLVYFGANNYLYALRASSGTLAWRYTATTTVGTSVFADVQRIYFGTIDGNLTALNTSTGAFAWHYQGTQGTPTVPTGALSLIYFGTGTTLFALNSQNGALSWSFHAPASLTASAPRAINQLVYIGTAAGALYALNQTTGGIVWIRQLGSSTTVVGPPHAIPDGSNLLIVGLNNQTVAALNWTTGSTVWIVPTTGTIATRLTIAGSGVYGSAFPSPLYKFNKANGATLWTANPGGPLNTSPVVH